MWILRRAALLAAVCAALLVPAGGRAAADVLVIIDKGSQRMSVAVNGRTRYVWPVSTGRTGYGTPAGQFRPQWMARTYFSKKYYDSPMPHSIFFYHGFAIHGTEYIHRLGGPASHGCVRLHPRNAATLFALVQRHGMRNTRIVIGDAIALKRPERWGALDRNEVRFIGLMTDRLMLAEQIERKEALAKMEQMRASAALKRIMERGARDAAAADEPAVAIGVQAEDRAAIPEPVVRVMPSAKLPPPAAARPQQRVQRPAPKPRQPAAQATSRARPAAKHRAAADRPKRRAAPNPGKRPARAEHRRRRISAASRPVWPWQRRTAEARR